MLIDVTTGGELFKDVSAKTHTFFVPSTKYPGTETHIGILSAVKHKENNPHNVTRLAKAVVTNAHTRLSAEMGGSWSTGTIDVPEGMVLKIFMGRSLGYGQMRVQGNLLIRVREYAAYRRIGIATTQHPDATNKDVHIEGRFDVLSIEEARSLGVDIPKGKEYFYDPLMIKKGFTEKIMYPEILSAPQLKSTIEVNSKGEEVEVILHRKRRMLKL